LNTAATLAVPVFLRGAASLLVARSEHLLSLESMAAAFFPKPEVAETVILFEVPSIYEAFAIPFIDQPILPRLCPFLSA